MLGDWSSSIATQNSKERTWYLGPSGHTIVHPGTGRSVYSIANGLVNLIFWTLLQGLYFTFQQARGLHRYDASGDASQLQNFFEDFSFDRGTTYLRHLLPGSGTKWAHFTLR